MIIGLCVELIEARPTSTDVGLDRHTSAEICGRRHICAYGGASTADQKALRAVCKHLRLVIEPLLCVSTTLVLGVKGRDGSPSQLEALAAGQTIWAHCRRLKIISLAVANDPMQKMLRSASESLKSLRVLDLWIIDDNDVDLDWPQHIVVDVMNHEYLNELCLVNFTTYGYHFFDLAPFSGLRILSIKTGGHGWTRAAMDWLSRVLYDMLQPERIQLKDVGVMYPEDGLMRYLASYSGLERLDIFAVHQDLDGEPLIENIVPRHGASLTVLICPGYCEGACSFSRRSIRVISQLRQLETLEVSINSFDIEPPPGSGVGDIVASLQTRIMQNYLRGLTWLVQELFLEMAVEMPALRNIGILAAAKPSTMYFRIRGQGGGWRGHSEVQQKITDTVDAFGRTRGTQAIAGLVETHHRCIESREDRDC
ncbi:hypothetical protein B0H19DRAFT_1263720 [Mycena capillaripes]|nr:hypothetical protein B0H19DRAFT_1263720 [Mycena capillaripes]